MATARMDFRLDEKLKEKVEKASALTGAKSITEYVISVMEKAATRDIKRYESLMLEDDMFDRFIQACEKVGEPNENLKDAVAFTRKQGIK